MMIAMIMNTPSMPMPIYFRLLIKLIGLNSMAILLYAKNPRTSAPAITDAICPDTLTPIECIRRKF